MEQFPFGAEEYISYLLTTAQFTNQLKTEIVTQLLRITAAVIGP